MIQTLTVSPGVTLLCCRDTRFKQGRLTVQFVRPMCRQEVSMNALLPAVLLRGTEAYPDIRAMNCHLDDLYGATVTDIVRRAGDCQTVGLCAGFPEDRFALEGDRILEPVAELLVQLLRKPVTVNGAFHPEYVAGEKKNLIAELEAQRDDKAAYAMQQLMQEMCRQDPFGIPQMGDRESIAAITAEGLYAHYRRILEESPILVTYVGSAAPEQIAKLLLKPLLAGLSRRPGPMPAQTSFRDGGPTERREKQEISQSRLCMGFVTEVTNRTGDFAAMLVFNTLFGGGMTSKLFLHVREKRSLCYAISSQYYGAKGLMTVAAGIDADRLETVRQEVLAQLEACGRGDFSPEELIAARETVLSSLRGVTDSAGGIEGYYASKLLAGLSGSLEEQCQAVEAVTAADVIRMAQSLRLHSQFFLEGGGQ